MSASVNQWTQASNHVLIHNMHEIDVVFSRLGCALNPTVLSPTKLRAWQAVLSTINPRLLLPTTIALIGIFRVCLPTHRPCKSTLTNFKCFYSTINALIRV